MPITRLPWAAAEPAIVRKTRAAKACFIGPVYLDQPRRLIQKNVDKYASYRDIQPDRQRPARDGLVPVEARFQSARQRDDGERRDGGGERDVRNKDAEVE